jgi:hypothetical protein
MYKGAACSFACARMTRSAESSCSPVMTGMRALMMPAFSPAISSRVLPNHFS